MISRNWTSFVSNSLVLCHSPAKVFSIFGVLLFTPKCLWKFKLNMFPVRMLLIRRKKSKGKYQNGSLTSANLKKKSWSKSRNILTLYRASHSADLRILDLQSISIGFPTVKMCHFWTNFFGRFAEVREPFWYFPFDFFLRIKSIRTGNIFTFNFQRDFGLNIDSWKIKAKNEFEDPEPRKLAPNHHILSSFVKSHYITYVFLFTTVYWFWSWPCARGRVQFCSQRELEDAQQCVGK